MIYLLKIGVQSSNGKITATQWARLKSMLKRNFYSYELRMKMIRCDWNVFVNLFRQAKKEKKERKRKVQIECCDIEKRIENKLWKKNHLFSFHQNNIDKVFLSLFYPYYMNHGWSKICCCCYIIYVVMRFSVSKH